MMILAVEGALARCSAALVEDGRLLAHAHAEAPRGAPVLLPPMVRDVLDRAGVAAAALDAVAVGVGPGGFTGLRAAIALAAGIAHGAGCRLVGVTTGEALLAGLPPATRADRPVWAAIDNRRGRVVIEVFPCGSDHPRPPIVADLAALPRTETGLLVVGDAAAAVADALRIRGDGAQDFPGLPDAAEIARLVAVRLGAGQAMRDAAPLYAEPPAVSVPAGEPRG